MSENDRISLLRAHLDQALSPVRLEIVDETYKHIGHAGSGGGGHFKVTVVSAAFAGKSTLERHRLVYLAVANLMRTEIHALGIQALTPEEEKDGCQ